jgi:hypothetical protein
LHSINPEWQFEMEAWFDDGNDLAESFHNRLFLGLDSVVAGYGSIDQQQDHWDDKDQAAKPAKLAEVSVAESFFEGIVGHDSVVLRGCRWAVCQSTASRRWANQIRGATVRSFHRRAK